MKKIPHFINNRPVDSQDGRTFDSVNPATQEVWAQAAHGGKAESDAAVSAARKAFDEGPVLDSPVNVTKSTSGWVVKCSPTSPGPNP